MDGQIRLLDKSIQPKKIHAASLKINKELISKNVLKIIEKLNASGFQAYLVGGCIRDLMLGMHPKDFDLTTDAKPQEIRRLFKNCRLIGRRFRLAHIRFGRELIEVATFRSSAENNQADILRSSRGRILRDNAYGSIEDDVFRRDFRCNALYYDTVSNYILDYVGGLKDIKSKRLVMIGNAHRRLHEDPVRMIRAIRFAAKLNFNIDAQLASSIKKNSGLLESIPAARIFDEFLKLFQSGYAESTFELLVKFGLFKELFPQTDEQINSDATLKGFIVAALQNTDLRFIEKKPITPMFLLGVFLWGPILKYSSNIKKRKKCSQSRSLVISTYKVIAMNSNRMAIPKRFSSLMSEMIAMQPRFEIISSKQAKLLSRLRIFRAAYDFLLLRSLVGDCSEEVIKFWSKVQLKTGKDIHHRKVNRKQLNGR